MKEPLLTALAFATLPLRVLAAVADTDPAAISINPGGSDSRHADKSQYHLFHPTPSALLREMSTDRPDKTESAYTVDAGHFQVEMDLVSYAHDHDTSGGNDTRVDAWSIAPINFKVGLLNWLDLQTVIESYNHVTTEDLAAAGGKTRRSGFGDITSRVKISLWGNDEGPTALSVMPFAKFPTNQDHLGNHSVEGGVIFPLAVELPAGFGLGLMTEFDFNRDGDEDGHHVEFVNTITVGHDIVGNLAGYIEFYSAVSTQGDAEWIGTVDLGLAYAWNENVQLDAGVNIGVTDTAADVNPFLGLSFRF